MRQGRLNEAPVHCLRCNQLYLRSSGMSRYIYCVLCVSGSSPIRNPARYHGASSQDLSVIVRSVIVSNL